VRRLGVARGEERDRVDLEQRILGAEVREQELTDRYEPVLDRALDLRVLDQRLRAVDHDLELAARALLHVVGEHADVARLELGIGVGGGEVPLHGLGGGRERQRKRSSEDRHAQPDERFHVGVPR
jgi:hypothetical protein